MAWGQRSEVLLEGRHHPIDGSTYLLTGSVSPHVGSPDRQLRQSNDLKYLKEQLPQCKISQAPCKSHPVSV